MRNRRVIIATIVGAVFACVAMTGSAFAGNTYKLAISLAITGPTSDAGNPYSKGVEDYVKYVNDNKILGDDVFDTLADLLPDIAYWMVEH